MLAFNVHVVVNGIDEGLFTCALKNCPEGSATFTVFAAGDTLEKLIFCRVAFVALLKGGIGVEFVLFTDALGFEVPRHIG